MNYREGNHELMRQLVRVLYTLFCGSPLNLFFIRWYGLSDHNFNYTSRWHVHG
jgi:hypothetical protein